jgi:hypothetical protein
MKKINQAAIFLLIAVFLAAPSAFAKKDGNPLGWGKGEKKGWDGGEMPPGLSKKDHAKAEKEAKKAKKAADKEAKRAKKEMEKAAKANS